jgi:hypothetical protein
MGGRSLLTLLTSFRSGASSSTLSRATERVDPIVESLWPLPVPEFSVANLRTWTEKTLRSKLTGDALRDNLILNRWEFAHGVTVLSSYPWRLSVPFALCNAHCEFCAAWQIKGNVLLDELITALIPVIRHCYQLDRGYGERLWSHEDRGAQRLGNRCWQALRIYAESDQIVSLKPSSVMTARTCFKRTD